MSGAESKPKGLLGRLFGGKPASPEASPPEAPIVAAAMPDEPVQLRDPEPPPAPPAKSGWFQRLKAGLTRSSSKLSDGIVSLFTKRRLDATTIEELEDLLIEADLGVETADRIVKSLKARRHDKAITPEEVRGVLAAEIEAVLAPVARALPQPGGHKPHVILVAGVNGTGKTTTIGKLAHRYRQDGKTVVLAAGDTFRAAAIDQLKIWGERTGAHVVARAAGADAAGLAFDAISEARERHADVILIDTAGRLQNKVC